MSDALPKARRFLDCDMRKAELLPIVAGQAAICSFRSPEKNTPNEDAAALIPVGPDSGVFVVADGMGGGQAGDHAAKIAVESLSSVLAQGAGEETLLRTSILNGFEQANEAILNLGVGAATTLAVVEIAGNVVRPYHVGDSVILIVGQRGKVKLQTTPHSPVGFAVEAGMLDEKEAIETKDRHVVSNVIGSSEMKIEIGPSVNLAARDTVLVASDGLFDNLHLSEIVDTIRKGLLSDAAEQLISLSLHRMEGAEDDTPSKPDDLTFILFRS